MELPEFVENNKLLIFILLLILLFVLTYSYCNSTYEDTYDNKIIIESNKCDCSEQSKKIQMLKEMCNCSNLGCNASNRARNIIRPERSCSTSANPYVVNEKTNIPSNIPSNIKTSAVNAIRA
jgi:uncharacterized protein (UPF0333 family)